MDPIETQRRPNYPLLLGVAGVIVYFNSLTAPFIFDDIRFIYHSDWIDQPWPIPTEVWQTRRPLLFLSLILNYAIGGTGVLGYHVFNILLHITTALTLFALTRRLLEKIGYEQQRSNMLAFGVSLIWTVHPLLTQSVTYIIQRGESMAALAMLIGLLAFTQGCEKRGCEKRGCEKRGCEKRGCKKRGCENTKRWKRWWMIPVAFAVGIFSKETAGIFPILLILLDWTFYSKSIREIWDRHRWVYASLLPLALFFTWRLVEHAQRPHVTTGFGLQTITPMEYSLSQPLIILHYLSLSFFPDVLCLDYWWEPNLTWYCVALPVAILTSFFIASIVGLAQRHPIGFVGMSFFLLLSPTSSIMPIKDLAAEHRMYLALACVTALFIIGTEHVITQIAKQRGFERYATVTFQVLLLVMALPLSYRTVLRNSDYQSPISIWKQTLDVRPLNPRAHSNYAVALHRQGKTEEALQHLFQAQWHTLIIGSELQSRYSMLGSMLGEIGRYEKAAFYLNRAIDLHNDSAQGHNNLGAIYRHLGDHSTAESHLRKAIRLRKKDPLPRANLARVMIDSGRLEEAELAIQNALTLNPELLLSQRTLVQLRLAQGKIEPAVELLERLIEKFPRASGLKHDLAMIFATHPESTKAEIERAIVIAEQLKEKLAGSFDAPRAFDLLAVTHAANGQLKQSMDASDTAIAKARSNQQFHLADEFENHRKLIASGRKIPFGTPLGTQ